MKKLTYKSLTQVNVNWNQKYTAGICMVLKRSEFKRYRDLILFLRLLQNLSNTLDKARVMTFGTAVYKYSKNSPNSVNFHTETNLENKTYFEDYG